jgi:hypothetical protein
MSLGDLLAKLDRPQPIFWRPEKPGDEIAGRVLSEGTVKTRFGERRYFTIQKPDGAQAKVLLTAVLQDEWKDVRPGWLVAARYLGKLANYKRFACAAEPPGEGDDAPGDPEPEDPGDQEGNPISDSDPEEE